VDLGIICLSENRGLSTLSIALLCLENCTVTSLVMPYCFQPLSPNDYERDVLFVHYEVELC
jgi:hypothetical protein